MTTTNSAAESDPVVVATATADASEVGGTKHQVFNESVIVILLMLMVFMVFESLRHKRNWQFGHESAVVCVIGIAISSIYHSKNSSYFQDIMEFNTDLFFYFVLPPIIFTAGFNMYRKRFFANIGNITLFGVLGTFITFGTFAALTYLVLNNFEFKQTHFDEDTGNWIETTVSMSTMEIILMSSLLCSTDVIAAISLIKPKKQPKLFSLIFGEGICNDAVAIILFNTVNKFALSEENKEFDGKDVGIISLNFLVLGIVSILIGVGFGLCQSYLMKKARSLTRDPVAECAIIFSIAYISYVTAELLHQSGIISLLTCGVVMAHYGWYNLSPQGQTSSNIVFAFLGFIAEGFIFSYLGLTFFSYTYMPFSISFICVMFGIVIIGRGAATVGLIGLLKLCGYEKNNPNRLTWSELAVIWYAGLIRGAIAFGLVLRIDSSFPNRDLIVTTCLTLVVFTTLLFGSTVGVLLACLFPDKKEKELEVDEIDAQEEEGEALESDSSASSDRSGLVHPNMQPLPEQSSEAGSMVADNFLRAQSVDAVVTGDGDGYQRQSSKKKKRKGKGCFHYIMTIDEMCMKPIFIRKYTPEKEQEDDEFMNTYMEEGNKIEHEFAKSEHAGSFKAQKTSINSGRRFGQDQ